MNGLLNMHKPPGMTSSDLVVRVRRALQVKKVGHAGTLDPAAAGVLPIMVGKATRLFDSMQLHDKTYMGEFLFGYTTDTLDTTGERLEARPLPPDIEQRLPQVLEEFRGTIDQVPPMYSALKLDGRKLYQIARKGESLDLPTRRVRIDVFEILDWVDARHARFLVRCSKGTYIRSLARDIGEKLGCGACLSALIRTQSGPFGLEQALTLDALWKAKDCGRAQALLLPMDAVLQHLRGVHVQPEHRERLLNGRSLWTQCCAPAPVDADGPFRLYCDGDFIGIGHLVEGQVRIKTRLL